MGLDFENGNNDNKNILPKTPENSIKQKLNFGSNKIPPEQLDTILTFEKYEEERLNHIKQNIDELMNYDKTKLIQKIKSSVKTLGDKILEEMPFSELWDILINDRAKTFTKSFKDSQYETIFTELFDRLSSFDSRNMNYQYENNNNNNSQGSNSNISVINPSENITYRGGANNENNVNNEVYNFPTSVDLSIIVAYYNGPVNYRNRNLDSLDTFYYEIENYKSLMYHKIPGTSDEGIIPTFNKLKTFMNDKNVIFHEEIGYLNNINDEQIIDLFRMNPYDNSEADKIRNFKLEKKDEDSPNYIEPLILILKEGNKHRLIILRFFKDDDKGNIIIPIVNEVFDEINMNSFPLNLKVYNVIKEELRLEDESEIKISVSGELTPEPSTPEPSTPPYRINGMRYNNSQLNSSFNNNNGLYSDNINNINNSTTKDSLSEETSKIKDVVSKNYMIFFLFDGDFKPKEYRFGKYNIETTYYILDNKNKLFLGISNLLFELVKSKMPEILQDQLIIGKIYIRTPNIEDIKELELKNNELVYVEYTNIFNNNVYHSLLNYNKDEKKLVNMFQLNSEIGSVPEILTLSYNGTKPEFIDTKISKELHYYSLIDETNYKDHKLDKLLFVNTPTPARNAEEESLISFDKRNFKLFRYNNLFDDNKSKADYFYMKQYFERLFNIHNLDHKDVLEVFKQFISDDVNIKERLGDMPLFNVEFYGMDKDGNFDTGIDDGGLRPAFFQYLGNELCNTFLSNIIVKGNETNIEGIISELEEFGQKVGDKYTKLQQCPYLSKEECITASQGERKDMCIFDEKYEICEPVNLEVPLVITKNHEKYNAFCRYNIPVEDSYKLAGALLAKMLISDNGIGLKYISKIPRISIPKLNLSYYLIHRLLENNHLDWVDIMACLKIDDPEKYKEIIGEKCSLLTKDKKIYSINESLENLDNELLKLQGVSKYSCKNFEEKFGGEDGCDDMTKENYLAHIYLKVLELYETDCLKEYFYLSKGFNLIFDKEILEQIVREPITPGIVHKLFFGKGLSISELLDVEYYGLDDNTNHIRDYYDTYIHNLFTINRSKIGFEFLDIQTNVNVEVYNGQSKIEFVEESNPDIYNDIDTKEGHKLLGFYRLQENLGTKIKRTPTHKNTNRKGILDEPVFMITEGKNPNIPSQLLRENIIILPSNKKLLNILSTNNDDFGFKNLFTSYIIVNESEGILAKPILDINNSEEQNEKIKKLLLFWTSQTVVPNKPNLNINIMGEKDRLPTAHTCYNRLDIPPYDSYKTFFKKLELALQSFSRNNAFTEEMGGGAKKSIQAKKAKKSLKAKKPTNAKKTTKAKKTIKAKKPTKAKKNTNAKKTKKAKKTTKAKKPTKVQKTSKIKRI